MRGHKESQTSKKLYKNPDSGKICGVCAGVAEYFGFEVWLVRIITISLILWLNVGAVIAYFALAFILDPKPGSQLRNRGWMGKRRNDTEENPERQPYRVRVKDVWRTGCSPSDTLGIIEKKFSKIEKELQILESYVTSEKFELERALNKIPD